jgi:hypothetical protein
MKKIVASFFILFAYGFAGVIAAHAAGPSAVNLSSSGNFAVLAKSGISTTGTTSIVGDIGVSPAAGTSITGFALSLSAGSSFATSSRVTGKVYAPGYANPTPAYITTAIGDMQAAYTDGAGRTNPTATELGAGNIGGMTLAPGLYKWGTGLTIPTNVTLSGGANDVWIFQIAQTLTVSSGVRVVLSGGARANNVFWIVGGKTTIGTGATFSGTILDQTAITLNTGATLDGRALAQTAVTLDANEVIIPSGSATTSTPTPAPSPSPSASSGGSSYSGGGYISSSTPNPVITNPTAVAASAFGQQVRTIARSLGQGSGGNDVMILQQFLISQNKGMSARALANVGATSFFGSFTRAALAEFQASVGISPALGNFGPITRGYVQSHY